ncbi:MAG: dicarboxylate/amino acid:cation symporter [Desulfotomaculaceae bacterium]|nr:dicarboxylate/amino acid:cation symporter [Desulfotomaculaceae bacterium]
MIISKPIKKAIISTSKPIREMLKQHLWAKMLAAMFLGIVVGIALNPSTGWTSHEQGLIVGNWLALPGKLFLSLIQMVVVPLVFASIVQGIASNEDTVFLKKLGLRLGVYFVLTSCVAIVIGIFVTMIINPGQYMDTTGLDLYQENPLPPAAEETLDSPTIGTMPDYLINLLPNNPLHAMVNTQMLQVVIFAIIIGIALVSVKPRNSRPLLDLMDSIQSVCMTIVQWAMYIAPLAVFGLLAQIVIQVGLEALFGMAAYVATAILGLLLVLCTYCIAVFFVTGMSAAEFLRKIRPVQILAFSTSSSAAVMPLSLQTAEEELKVRPGISQFIIPLGTTINMDGTALYQAAATIFLAQVFNVDLSSTALLIILVTSVGASIGTPATPGAGIVILATILTSVGIPTAGIAIILGVDRILDMCRTSVNVTGDLTASLLMNKWLK